MYRESQLDARQFASGQKLCHQKIRRHNRAHVVEKPTRTSKLWPIAPSSSVLGAITILCAFLSIIASLSNHQAHTLQMADARWSLAEDNWNYWWSYSGVSGPSYWGLLNPEWILCDKGRRQSPINIDTSELVYDPHLTPLRIADNNLISGILYNDGHTIVFNGSASASLAVAKLTSPASSPPVGRIDNNGQILNLGGGGGGGNNNSSEKKHHVANRRSPEGKELTNIAFEPDDFIMDEPEFVAGPHQVRMIMQSSEQQLASNDLPNSPNQFDGTFVASSMLDSANRVDSPSANKRPETVLADGAIPISSSASDEELELVELQAAAMPTIDFSGAGLAYSYRFELLQFRFGGQNGPQSSRFVGGSEHLINKRPFAAELQLLAYNWHLYRSFQEASTRPYGLLGVSILIDTLQKQQPTPFKRNDQLERLLHLAGEALVYRNQFVAHNELNLTSLLPDTDQLVTYDGSLTQPGCHESVTWLLLNKPLYATKQSLDKLRLLTADEQSAPSPSGTLLGGNARPVQPINGRPIRTNIRPTASDGSQPQVTCSRLRTRYEYLESVTT